MTTKLILSLALLAIVALPANGTAPPAEFCTSVNPQKRVSCGYGGITKWICEKKNCCWDDKVNGVPWCFYENYATPSKEECQTDAKKRQSCGYGGITKEKCERERQCCWDSSVNGVPWCFQRKSTLAKGICHKYNSDTVVMLNNGRKTSEDACIKLGGCYESHGFCYERQPDCFKHGVVSSLYEIVVMKDVSSAAQCQQLCQKGGTTGADPIHPLQSGLYKDCTNWSLIGRDCHLYDCESAELPRPGAISGPTYC